MPLAKLKVASLTQQYEESILCWLSLMYALVLFSYNNIVYGIIPVFSHFYVWNLILYKTPSHKHKENTFPL